MKEQIMNIAERLHNGILRDTAQMYSDIIERFMKQYPMDNEITPELFYLLFDFESDKIRDALIPAYFPQAVENRKYANAIANWNAIYRIVGQMAEKKMGNVCCMDCGRWIANQYLQYTLDGTIPDMEIDEHCYWKPAFGTGEQWMTLCSAITRMTSLGLHDFHEAYELLME